jgi:hypothetical protein
VIDAELLLETFKVKSGVTLTVAVLLLAKYEPLTPA